MKKILVLAGGSVKGAFQAGVIKAVFESGFEPDAIYGVSAGSMNASFLIDNIGKQSIDFDTVNLSKAAKDLCNFWIQKINTPDSLALRRPTYELGFGALRGNFEGLLDTAPLRHLVHENVSIQNLLASPIKLKVGAVDIINGDIEYVEPSTEHFLDYIMASSAIPILMPVVNIGGHRKQAFLDGGLRDVAPIKQAILDGAEEIVCIACHTKEIDAGYFRYGNLLALVDRVMDIAVNECLNADLEYAQTINQFLPDDGSVVTEGILKGKRKIKLTIIRPNKPLNIDIQAFDADDITRVIGIGYETGKQKLSQE
jgi:NTE family protein